MHNPEIIPGRVPLGPDPGRGTGVGTGIETGTATGTDPSTGINGNVGLGPGNAGTPGTEGTGTKGTSTYGGTNNGNPGGGTRHNNPSGPSGPGVRSGTGPWVGLGPRPGLPAASDTGTQRTNANPNHPRYQGPNTPLHRDRDGHRNSNVKGVYPDIGADGANVDPGYSPRNYDPVMAFVSSATAAIGCLTLASTVLGIYLLHRRQQSPGSNGSKPFTR